MKKILYFIAIVSILSSCEDIIDVDLHSVAPEVVIEGVIRMDEYAHVFITKTKDFDADNNYTPIKDAQVVITDDAGNSEELKPDASGRYVATSIIGVEKRTYNLSVTYEEKNYTATSYMPPRVEIDSITAFRFPVADCYYPQVHFADPLGEENQYYRFVCGINNEWPKNIAKLQLSTEFLDGNVIHDPIFFYFDDDNDDDDVIQNGNLITLEMQCIDRGTYYFFETLSNTGMAAANPTTNIKGGALGYFGAYSYTQLSAVMEW
ncbi:DUF4249 domain-containing protein [Bacteroides sp. 519]|uniref:DUF4249 domain-containing protein n=1 Tax=Bacteroides sp. 519 TaxID=2302937 RepID=UPI0013D4E590|nr:DUF4249 domain-containing protein [Bacteroides sp. 519]NDV57921.1 DUF4249 domain-containing protein [Bacteroides sp. 519]